MTTVYLANYDANMEFVGSKIVYLKLILWIILMDTLQLSIVKGFPTNQFSNNMLPKTAAPSCGGNYVARSTGQLISLPKYNENKSISCEWTITTPNPKMTIGLSYVGVTYNYWIHDNVKLDIYDGPFASVNTPKLSSLSGKDDLIQFYTRIETSSTHIVFINFTSLANDHHFDKYNLEFSIAYYICGGIVNTPMVIQSPRFNLTGNDEMIPTSIRCVWRINRPDYYLYGHIRINEINTATCDVVTVTVVRGRLGCANSCFINTTEEMAANPSLNFTIPTNSTAENSNAIPNERVEDISNQTVENQTLALCTYYNIDDLAFSGDYAFITYEVFFNNAYIPNFFQAYGPAGLGRSSKQPKAIPWYLNYAPVAIYVPIGLIFGFLIIYLQVRPRKLVTRTRVSITSCDNSFHGSSASSDPPVASIMKTNKEDEVKKVKFESRDNKVVVECKTNNNNKNKASKSPAKKVRFG